MQEVGKEEDMLFVGWCAPCNEEVLERNGTGRRDSRRRAEATRSLHPFWC